MNPGDSVFVAEHGHGARPARIVRCYERDGKPRIVVSIEGQKAERDCFAESVYRSRKEAEQASQ